MGERWERNKFKEESRKVVIWTFEMCSVLTGKHLIVRRWTSDLSHKNTRLTRGLLNQR